MGRQEGTISHMAPSDPPPFLTNSDITTAARTGRPHHREPQTNAAGDGSNGRKGKPKRGNHHHNAGNPAHATCSREEGHNTSRALGVEAARSHLPVSHPYNARPPKDLGRPRLPEERKYPHLARDLVPHTGAGPPAKKPHDHPHGRILPPWPSLSHGRPCQSERCCENLHVPRPLSGSGDESSAGSVAV